MANPYGFDWGPAKVERACHVDGRGYVLEIHTQHARLQVYISEQGRKIKPYPLEPYKVHDADAR
jgi:hypothetical protein